MVFVKRWFIQINIFGINQPQIFDFVIAAEQDGSIFTFFCSFPLKSDVRSRKHDGLTLFHLNFTTSLLAQKFAEVYYMILKSYPQLDVGDPLLNTQKQDMQAR